MVLLKRRTKLNEVSDPRTPEEFCSMLMTVHHRNLDRVNSLVAMQKTFAGELLEQRASGLNDLLNAHSPEFGEEVVTILEKISGKSRHHRN